MHKTSLLGLATYLLATVPACTTDSGTSGTAGDTDGEVDVPERYEFDSRFGDGDSVSYSGQVFRHALIMGLKSHLANMTARIDDGDLVPAAGDVVAELDFFYRFDSDTAGSLPIGIQTTPPAAQTTWNDLSSGKDLQGKIAGSDETGQHKDWVAEGIVGWDGNPSPDALVGEWFAAVEGLAIDRVNGTLVTAPDGSPVSSVFVSADGRDYQQLLQKFLLGAVAYSQGADDYLDDDTEGKGLLSDNSVAEGGKPYTALEHAWDEGFGYFGASRDYLDHSDDALADEGHFDADGDGAIDLTAEFVFGHAQNAAKRDRGSSQMAPTDFTTTAMDAFLRGRAIIASADGPLSDQEMANLVEQRDLALEAWEMAIVATVVHYINETLADMASFDTQDYDFEGHAKHWSEMEGFALSVQFNPHRRISDSDLSTVYELLGDAPALPGDPDAAAYADGLRQARDILSTAYEIDPANQGDENGAGGW